MTATRRRTRPPERPVSSMTHMITRTAHAHALLGILQHGYRDLWEQGFVQSKRGDGGRVSEASNPTEDLAWKLFDEDEKGNLVRGEDGRLVPSARRREAERAMRDIEHDVEAAIRILERAARSSRSPFQPKGKRDPMKQVVPKYDDGTDQAERERLAELQRRRYERGEE